jgi:hypothetical protein
MQPALGGTGRSIIPSISVLDLVSLGVQPTTAEEELPANCSAAMRSR